MAHEKITQLQKMASFLAETKQLRRQEARRQALPPAYRTAHDGLWRYLLAGHLSSAGDETIMEAMMLDLLTQVEQWAADGVEIREVVGADPILFADELFRRHNQAGVTDALHSRLRTSIDEAAAEQRR